jgi:D-alanyl-D-alanine carboxypeptidase
MRVLVFAVVAFVLTAILPAQSLPEQVDAILNRPEVVANDWTILVENADGTVEYYARRPDRGLIPASNTKLFTTAAAYGLLGLDHEFETRIYHTGTFVDGTIAGDIVLLTEHDPTWNAAVFGTDNARRALDHIAVMVAMQGVRAVQGAVLCYGATVYNQGSTGTSHNSWWSAQAARNNEAAVAFRDALNAIGIATGEATAGVHSFDPPEGARLLYTHKSGDLTFEDRRLTIEIVARPINRPSHNPMADLLLRHIGYKLDPQRRDTYTAGEHHARLWLRDTVGMDVRGLVLQDGSGLEYANTFSARQTVHLLRWMNANYPQWNDSLTVSGVTGTIRNRMTDLPGLFRGKTGSLRVCIALSGYLDNPHDGRRYYMGMIANNERGVDQAATRAALDDVVRLFAQPGIPTGPTALGVRREADGTGRVEWSDNGLTASDYRVLAGTGTGGFAPLATDFAPYVIETAPGGAHAGDYAEWGAFEWTQAHSTAPGLTAGIGSRFARATAGPARARFAPSDLASGRYRIDVTCPDFPSAKAPATRVRISDAAGTRTATWDISHDTAGNRWRAVGELDFVAGAGHFVEFDNAGQVVTGENDRLNVAAVRFVPQFHRDRTGARAFRVVLLGPHGEESEPSNVVMLEP